MAHARALDEGIHPPEATAERHHEAMAIRGLVAQEVRGVVLRGFLREAVRGAAVEDAGAEHARQAVCGEGAQGRGPRPLVFRGGQVHVGVRDLARLVEGEVEAVGTVGRVRAEDSAGGFVRRGGGAVRGVGFVRVGARCLGEV